MLKNIGALLTAMTILSGCSLLSPVADPQSTYLINTTPHAVLHTRSKAGTIMVVTPKVNPVYNSTEIAYSTYPHQIAYFAKNTWAAAPAEMLKPLIIDTLQRTHHFKAVTSSELVSNRQYALYTQIVQLEQVFTDACQHSAVHLTVRVQLVGAATGEVIGTREFKIVEPALQNNPYGGVLAANKATEKMLTRLAAFCVKKTR